jgi:hypothetical protein
VNWNGEQLRILRELGHEPMLLVSSMPPDAGAAASRDSGVRAEQSRLTAAPVSGSAAGAAESRLAAAIARAAGGRDVSALALDLQRLRLEPALKRALWPQLRALRREH